MFIRLIVEGMFTRVRGNRLMTALIIGLSIGLATIF